MPRLTRYLLISRRTALLAAPLGVFRNGLRPRQCRTEGADQQTDGLDVASVSKQFTATSILLLVQEGRLRLDDDVRQYLPELPDYSRKTGSPITIRHLLKHTSGLRDYTGLLMLGGRHYDNVWSDDEALAAIVRQKDLNFSTGSDW
jgi:CubicO group peptidase (beta-lactamase class C family)